MEKHFPASPGAAAGKIVFTAEDAKRLVKENKKERVILVRLETSPEDIEGMHAHKGILTVRGGMTSPCGSRGKRHGNVLCIRLWSDCD